jgi:uncharacterized damage-inducible protein DinB
MDSVAAIAAVFLQTSSANLQRMQGYIHACFAKLSDDQIWMRNSPSENAPGNLVLHLCGNVRQWIGSYVGGLEDVRNRPEEFRTDIQMDRAALLAQLDETLALALDVLGRVPAGQLPERIPVQDGQVKSVLEAIYHVVGHFQQHTGQIIFITKLLTSEGLGFYQPAPAASR